MNNTLLEADSFISEQSLSEDGEAISDAVRLEPGMVIPGTRYRIERWLGEGGVGVVFECSHVELKRRAALKVLKASLGKNAAALFREEAIAAAKAHLRSERESDRPLGSPHIVDVFDVGELPDGRLWIAMELLDGVSLSSELKDGRKPIPMPVSRAVGILRQVCKGLGAAHRAGVVHRDVKPANVMLVRSQGKDDAVKLVDFGVAATPDGEERTTGVVAGTPPYMAPEQITGDDFDHRLDIYAVGCMAYRMLTGDLPFRAGTLFQLFRAHREKTPRRPSEVHADVPTSFDPVLLKCLAKAPADRYQSMDELEAALCEAQLSAGLITPWDELSLPPTALPFKDRYVALTQAAPTAPVASRWVWPAIAGLAVAVAAFVVWRGDGSDASLAPGAVVAGADDEVAGLVLAAQRAAAAAHWIYPDPVAPDEPTAYVHVLSLERLDRDDATDAAGTLRSEYAHALNRLGDRYWEHPDGKAFAIDYYAQASLFEPSTASPRLVMTPGERMLLSERAAKLDFSEEDLRATQPLIALAEPDEALRDQKLLEVLDDEEARAGTTSTKLENLLQPSTKARRTSRVAVSTPSPAEPQDEDAVVVEDEPERRPADRSSEASSLAAEGRRALAIANRSKAERLFNRALALDSNNAAALYGLGVVQFDRGAYGKATRTLGRAVAARPRNKDYRLKLGDAHFKNFQYNDARRHYQKAADLGSKAAGARLKKVDAKLR